MKRVERDIVRFSDGFRARRTIFIEDGEFYAKRFGDFAKVEKDSFGVWKEKQKRCFSSEESAKEYAKKHGGNVRLRQLPDYNGVIIDWVVE
jgi:hypothetical protein